MYFHIVQLSAEVSITNILRIIHEQTLSRNLNYFYFPCTAYHNTEITCTELTTLGNGTISTDTGSDSLVLGLGSIATYTCNTGFGLVGQTTRVCEDTNGGTVTTETWSGSAPTCEGRRIQTHRGQANCVLKPCFIIVKGCYQYK